ncbi:response regulator [Pleurocapsa sp. PCC 7319]|uniref:response regulator n=1 Tax=Pleurocapsa sp. PCC 7319 TaxID=118161 RepID=UPI0003722B88|nr:response regulator [Pleurocapsa sp. PCC 7319]
MRILLIDDDESLMEVLADNLIKQHYAVDIANDGEMGWEFILLFNYDLVVLDWMLPDVEGVSLCQRIRTKGYKMPILLLTARDRANDKVMGLDAGADDYVVKPFDFEELTARIRALLRRDIHVASSILKWQNLSLNPKTHEVSHQDQLLPLTPKEYGLIELFIRHPQQVFSPGAIINNLWAGEDPPGEEAVRTHIKGLRQKLKAAGMTKDTIQTVYGVGYRLKAIEKTESHSVKSNQSDISERIKAAWATFKNVTQERITVLEQLTGAISQNQVNREIHDSAKSAAHKLAGSLGGFGFPQGSIIAKEIENLLANDLTDQIQEQQLIRLVNSLQIEIQHQPFVDHAINSLGKTISLLLIEREIISENLSLTKRLIKDAEQWGIKIQTAARFKRAREIIAANPPTIILLQIVFPDGEDLAFLEEIHQQIPLLPIAVVINNAQFNDRLELVRRGASLVLQHSLATSEIFTSLTQMVKNLGSETKIMIVDDDPQILLSLKISLQPWGFIIKTLEQPEEFWEILESFNPDLLVLDIEMPEVNGIEICQVLRSDHRWQQLPVLFLTVHHDQKTQHQAFAVGADDYIYKPILGAELANRIINRLQRSRILKSGGLAVSDSDF